MANILIASIAVVYGVELCFGSLRKCVHVSVCVSVRLSASDTTTEKMRVFLLNFFFSFSFIFFRACPQDRSLYTVNFLGSSSLKTRICKSSFLGEMSQFHFRKEKKIYKFNLDFLFISLNLFQRLDLS